VASATNCTDQSASKRVPAWLDPASYVLAPGGAAESAAGWTLTGGAAIASGNEPARVTSASDSHSLSLRPAPRPRPTRCASASSIPDLRFFASSSLLRGSVYVDVLFLTASGDVASAPVGWITAGFVGADPRHAAWP